MANEARVFAEGVGNFDSPVTVRQYTVADGTAIAKGAMLVYGAASRTVVAAGTSLFQRPAGFATSSKEASDGRTEIGVQQSGVVDAYIDGVVTTGDIVVVSRTTANRVESIATGGSLSLYQDLTRIVGRALESGTDGQQIRIALTLA